MDLYPALIFFIAIFDKDEEFSYSKKTLFEVKLQKCKKNL